MIFSLLLVEKEGLGCPSSPQLLSGPGFAELLHLVYESKNSNTIKKDRVKRTQ